MGKQKTYKIIEDPAYQMISEPEVAYMQSVSRSGLSYAYFQKLCDSYSALSMKDWAEILHISERTLQRYEKDEKLMASTLAEKLIQMSLLLKTGLRVFEDAELFNQWLNTPNIALGKVAPKSLLDTHFGIEMAKDILIRAEQGIFS